VRDALKSLSRHNRESNPANSGTDSLSRVTGNRNGIRGCKVRINKHNIVKSKKVEFALPYIPQESEEGLCSYPANTGQALGRSSCSRDEPGEVSRSHIP